MLSGESASKTKFPLNHPYDNVKEKAFKFIKGFLCQRVFRCDYACPSVRPSVGPSVLRYFRTESMAVFKREKLLNDITKVQLVTMK